MIVISGALVVVAIVLLAIGIFSSTLGFVYASIAGSVVAFAFLIVGVLQRRGEEVPQVGTAAPALASSNDVEGVTAIIPASRPLPSDSDRPAAASASAGDDVRGTVLVVEGRPRYHVPGCRYLTGKEAAEVAVGTARADGFTACGVCKPDEALAAATTSQPAAEPAEAETTRRAPARTAAKAPAKKAPAKAAPAKTTAKKAPAKTPAKTATKAAATTAKKAAPAKTAPAKTATKAAKAPAKKAAARTTAAKAPAKKAPAKKAAARR